MTRSGFFGAFCAALALAACSTAGGPASPATTASKPSGKVYLRQEDLQGKDIPALDDMLGAPSLTRAEGAGEFRRYAFSACTLIVILYPDDKGAARVQKLDAAARVSGEAKPDLDQCLARGPMTAKG